MESFDQIKAWVRDQEVGAGAEIDTPFGRRAICYADLTATGRHLRAVERWLEDVRRYYANTHTQVSSTGRVMTRLREEAREAIRDAVGAGHGDEVLFVGSGATAAVNKLVGLMGLRIPEPLEREYGLSQHVPADQRPVVFVGPFEHHSNELPWIESIAEVIEIGLDATGSIDLDDLRARLAEYAHLPLRIGTFSAGSNVTGLLADVRAIARVLHEAEAFAFFDYAAAAPYVPIDMHPLDSAERIDALFLSPHKFIGGPEASGVLVADRRLFRTRVPERPGGGTVDYVAGGRRQDIDYIGRLDEREEGGTPAIIGDIRAGLAFQLKERCSPDRIREHEIEIARDATDRLSRHPRIRVLGPTDVPRLAILPLEIDGLHHEFASTLLDHLFGIQNRAGCSCAGPYGHRLLGIDLARSAGYRAQVRRGLNGIKPGWVRLSLPWYASADDLDFILSAVEFVADRGLDFVPLYSLDWQTGAWIHRDTGAVEPAGLRLSADDLVAMQAAVPEAPAAVRPSPERARARYFEQARELAERCARRWERESPDWNPSSGDPAVDDLIWFRFVHATRLDEPHGASIVDRVR